MRACFLGQNICVLGFGVANLQAPPLVPDEQGDEPLCGAAASEHVSRRDDRGLPAPLLLPLIGSSPL
jgi:hypothetical protein